LPPLLVHSFSERVVNRWNQLDKDTVEALSLNSFKNRLAKLRRMRMGFFMDFSLHSPSGWIKCFTWCSRTRYITRYMTLGACPRGDGGMAHPAPWIRQCTELGVFNTCVR